MFGFSHFRCLARSSVNKYFSNNWRYKDVHVRHLFTKKTMELDSFEKQVAKTEAQFYGKEDKFKELMRQHVNSDKKNLIFSDDIKAMIYLSKTDDDLKLLKEMMVRFHGQNQELRFATFTFGTPVMRMYHVLGKEVEALDSFHDEKLDMFFDQLGTYLILMDLLYEKGEYESVIDVHKVLMDKRIEGVKYPKDVLTLNCAACYKINTPQSLEYGYKLFKEGTGVGAYFTGRSRDFLTALALNNKQPQIAAEILAGRKISPTMSPSVLNLQVLCFAALKKYEEAMQVLDSILRVDVPETVRTEEIICQEVFEKLRESLQQSGIKTLQTRIQRLEKALQESKKITTKTLDYFLTLPINIEHKTNYKKDRFSTTRRKA